MINIVGVHTRPFEPVKLILVAEIARLTGMDEACWA